MVELSLIEHEANLVDLRAPPYPPADEDAPAPNKKQSNELGQMTLERTRD